MISSTSSYRMKLLKGDFGLIINWKYIDLLKHQIILEWQIATSSRVY